MHKRGHIYDAICVILHKMNERSKHRRIISPTAGERSLSFHLPSHPAISSVKFDSCAMLIRSEEPYSQDYYHIVP